MSRAHHRLVGEVLFTQIDRTVIRGHDGLMVRFRWPWAKKEKTRETQEEKTQHQEKVPRIASLAAAALAHTRTILEKTGSRPSGSEASRMAAHLIHDELQKNCDRTETQEFNFSSRAYSGWIVHVPYVALGALVLVWVGLPLIALFMLGIFFFHALMQFIRIRPHGEWFLHKDARGMNVHGIIEPAGPIKRTIVFSGHHDSARLDRFTSGDKRTYRKAVWIPLFVVGVELLLVVLLSLGSLWGLSGPVWEDPLLLAVVGGMTLVWPLSLPLRKFYTGEVSPGAGDNLVSSCIAVELSRYFAARRRRGGALQGTRLVFASFDGEEAGVRGSRDWFSRNTRPLVYNGQDPAEVLAFHFNMDCLFSSQELALLATDANGTQALSQRFASYCADIAQGMGYDVHSQKMPFWTGATDALEGSRAGLLATTLMGVPWDDSAGAAVYHTMQDIPDAIDIHALEIALALCIKLVQTLENEYAEGEESPGTGEEETPLSLRFSRLTKR